jgi:hypothetical protein
MASARDPADVRVVPAGPKALPVPRWAEWLVRFLDDAVPVPGTGLRFGADALLGLIVPGGGDALSGVLSAFLFLLAVRRDVPRRVLWAMAGNTALDALVGSVPMLGDAFDLGFKANRRNLALLQASAGGPEAPRAGLGSVVVIGAVLCAAVLLPLVVGLLLMGWLWRAQPAR